MANTLGQLAGGLQNKVKGSSSSIVLFIFKLMSGAIFGLTFALVGEELVGYGTFSFVFILVLFNGVFFRIAKGWSYIGVFVFDLVCVLVGLLLRMYIVIAPGI